MFQMLPAPETKPILETLEPSMQVPRESEPVRLNHQVLVTMNLPYLRSSRKNPMIWLPFNPQSIITMFTEHL